MPDREPGRPPDLRRYGGQLDRELIAGGALILLAVGGGLIALIWGVPALVGALPCFVGLFGLGLVLWLVLKALEWAGREPD